MLSTIAVNSYENLDDYPKGIHYYYRDVARDRRCEVTEQTQDDS
jgi:hypothetical protein